MALGVLGLLWKKKFIYTIITYFDGNDDQTIVLDFSNNLEYAQNLIYTKMLESRNRDDVPKVLEIINWYEMLKFFRNSVLCSNMSLSYNGKCDKCGKIRPDILIEVYKERGDGVLTPMIWCLDCLRSGQSNH